MIKTISYLGLGTMGSGMASNLLKASYQLTVWNRSTGKYEPFARKGARVANFRSPLLVSNDQNILKRDFSPSFALKLMLKHAGLIENFGNNLQSPIPALRVAEKHLASAVALGV